jgi:hypothetical protein
VIEGVPLRLAALCLFLVPVLPAAALAVDGVIEINQARALAGGISAGDAPGFPVTLSARGKYQLTSNLDVPGVGGILITATAVTVDLNGFTITCTPPSCRSGVATGVEATPLTLQNITVRRGAVRDFARGVMVGNYSVVEDVTATNDATAISVGVASVVRGCIVTGADGGITASGGTLIERNVIADNAFWGLCSNSQVPSAYRDNVLSRNLVSHLCVGSPHFVNTGGNLCDTALCP